MSQNGGENINLNGNTSQSYHQGQGATVAVTGVTSQHCEYTEKLKRWNTIDDTLAGEDVVKSKGVIYLPMNNAHDQSAANIAAYTAFLLRAVFYGIPKRTKDSLLGLVFKKPPKLIIPESLEYIKEDVDGSGVSIYQQSRTAFSNVMTKGRRGLLVDFPETGGEPISIQRQKEEFLRATIASYSETQIINWATTKIGGRHVLSLVVLHEIESERSEDGFSSKKQDVYRVLRLEGKVYTQELWKKSAEKKDNGGFVLHSSSIPTANNGQPLDFIPFAFIGSVNNDHNVDDEPFYDLCTLTLAHYRNSGSYENSVFWVGEAQPVITGLNETRAKALEKSGVYIGSSSPLVLNENSTYQIHQVSPNTMVKEAMDGKLEIIGMLGARLVTKGEAVKTATEAQSENESENSIASMVAGNVSQAYTKCLEWMQLFNDGGTQDVEFHINQDYVSLEVDPNMIAQFLSGIMQGKLTETDLWEYLRKRGIIKEDKTDDDIKDELEDQALSLGGTGSGFDLDNDSDLEDDDKEADDKKPIDGKKPAPDNKPPTD